MSKKISNTGKAIANLLVQELPNITRRMPLDQIQNAAEAFADEWRIFQAVNTAPKVPQDDPPGETKYPDRGNPAPVSVPDPAETEGTESTKKEFPAYNRFLNNVQRLMDSGKTLFEIESGEGPDSDEKNTARRNAFDDVEQVRSAIYGL